MADPVNPEDDVKVYAPDKTLQTKAGGNLDQVFSPQVVATAQNVIQQSADQFLEACLEHMTNVEKAAAALLQATGSVKTLTQPLIDEAFALKAKAGIGGYDLAAALSKSLHLYCEQIDVNALSARNREIIQWHVTTLKLVFAQRMKGTAGAVGTAIMAELEKLGAPQKA